MKKLGLALAAVLIISASQASANLTPSYESSRANILFSGLLSGNYAGRVAGTLANDLPLIGGLTRLFSLEDEAAHWLERESARAARGMFRDQALDAGFIGSYSISSYSPSSQRKSGSSSTGKPKLRARVSTHRIGVSLLVRF